MIRVAFFVGLASLLCLGTNEAAKKESAALPDPGDAILGQWVTEDDEARVEITKSKDKYHGRIVWLKEPDYPAEDAEAGKPKRDRNNPDETKRGRSILGLQIVNDFVYAGDKTWKKGTVYDPNNGKTYKGAITLENPDTLKLRGYVGISLLGRTAVWTRYTPPTQATSGNDK